MLSSLRTRLIVISVSIVVVALGLLSAINLFTTNRNTIEAMNTEMSQLSDSYAGSIGDWIRAKRAVTGSLRHAVGVADPKEMLLAAKEGGATDAAYIAYPDKRMLSLDQLPDGYDPTGRPWYKDTVAAGVPFLTKPYVDATTKNLVVTFAEPVGPKGNPTAVVGTDVQMFNVVRIVDGIKPTPSSFAFVADKDGQIITHPNKDLVLKSVSDLDATMTPAKLAAAAGEKLAIDVRVGGVEQFLFVRKIPDSNWMLVMAVDKNEVTAPVRSLLKLSIVVGIVAAIAAALLLAAAVTNVLKRLGVIRDAMRDIGSGEGDLTRRLDEGGRDELSEIASAFNQFADKIAHILLDIRRASESVKVSSGEIASGNLDLSSRTEQQAGSLEETASAMEELTSTVKQNADNARQANQLAVSASDVAVQGGEVVGQVVETMSSINESSRKIVDIISVIDGIAFQTNILALNAAVEAARAGEQGRGFAVVASEVRSLAQRSASAAKEIKALIDDSVHKVETGSQLVAQAGTTMNEVVASVRRVTDIVGEISAASQEQSAGIAEVGNAVTLMDEATQQNAALVEQAAAAAKSLQEQAAQLAGVVSTFKLDDGPAVHRPVVAAPVKAAPRQAAPKDVSPARPALKEMPAAKPALASVKAGKPAAAAATSASTKAGAGASATKAGGGGDDWEEF